MTPKTAKQIATENLAKPDLRAYIDDQLSKLHDEKIASVMRGEYKEEVPVLCGDGRQELRPKDRNKKGNNIMNNNQLLIKERIQTIFSILGRYDKAVTVYGTEKVEISAQPWNEAEKARRLSTTAETLRGAVQRCYDDISKELEVIKKTAIAMENAFELTPELNAAIALVSAVGDKLPRDTRQNLVASFVGQKQALVALCSIFEARGVETGEVKRYIFDAGLRCEALEETAYRLVSQSGSNIGVVLSLVKELEAFAKLEGVELTSKFTSENANAYLTARMRESMGLPVAL